jgi:flagellar hook protein FlgE
LVNSDGVLVKGFAADETGKITSKLDAIKLQRVIMDAKKTEKVDYTLNLDVRDNVKGPFDPLKPNETSNYSTGTVVYDSAGNAHGVTIYFNKVADNTWEWNVMAKGDEITGGVPGQGVIGATGQLQFTTDGKLQQQTISANSFNFNKGALPNQAIDFRFGDDILTGGTGLKGATQYGGISDLYKQIQDGYAAGTVGGLSFNEDGTMAAYYTNGVTRAIAQIAIAKFENNEGLYKAGNNLFRESRNSGQPVIGAPAQAGRGKVFSKSIESSTTDIANEFVNLIQMQRAFQANSRTLTTSDELMQEIINIRRG